MMNVQIISIEGDNKPKYQMTNRCIGILKLKSIEHPND